VKILVISNYRGKVSSRPEAEAMLALAKMGVNLTIMTFEDAEYATEFKKAGIRVIDFYTDKRLDKKDIAFIRNELKKGKYDIVHLFYGKAIVNGIRAARGLPVKVVLYRGYLGHINWWDPIAYFKFLHPRVDKIWCIAQGVADYVNRQTIFTKKKAVCIHKGHHPSWYEGIEKADLSEFNIPQNAFVASIIANTRPMKGIPYLIKATYDIPKEIPFYLLLIGKGLDTEEVKKLVQKSPHKDRIIFTGFRDDARSIVKATDVYVLSSLFGEATNKSVIEAMSVGVAPVITDIEGNKGLVIDGECGIVVPKANSKAIADALIKLYENPDLRKKFAEAAPSHIAENFSTEKTAKELKEFYENMLK